MAALAARGRVAEAKQAQEKLEGMRITAATDAARLNAHRMYGAAASLAAAQVQMAEHKDRDAIVSLRAAAAQEDKLSYDEPADGFIPVRHMLGAELIKSDKFAQAESSIDRPHPQPQ